MKNLKGSFGNFRKTPKSPVIFMASYLTYTPNSVRSACNKALKALAMLAGTLRRFAAPRPLAQR